MATSQDKRTTTRTKPKVLRKRSMGKLAKAVAEALNANTLDERDRAAAELAMTYATELDEGDADITKIGPALLATLEALRLTPRSRLASAQKGQAPDAATPGTLDELRERRRRKYNATTVDAAVEGSDT